MDTLRQGWKLCQGQYVTSACASSLNLVVLLLCVFVQGVQVPVLLPGAKQPFVSLSPSLSNEDKQVVENVVKIGETSCAMMKYSSTCQPCFCIFAQLDSPCLECGDSSS